MFKHPFLFLAALAAAATSFAAPAPAPLRILLITGGCCHDYVKQKDILKAGLEQRANVVVEHLHTADKTTRPALACQTDPNYARGYDLIIHDECAADISDADAVRNVLAPHRDGIPGVALHCAMHSYRVAKDFRGPQAAGSDGAMWFEFLGLQSGGHGPQEPIAITFVPDASPITKGMANWTTIKEELYNNVQPITTFAGHRSLAKGRQTTTSKDGVKKESESVIVWTNEYGAKKTRVFATTIGHNNATVEDARYLDLITRGVLWAAGRLDANGQAEAGYGAAKR
jgi:type 1 glutamine amidotransferase